jgi:8-amino-7-oxononanoate synthase
MAYQRLGNSEGLRLKLKENIQLFKLRLKSAQMPMIASDSPIQCLLAGSNEKAKELATHLQKVGLDVRPILSPTVAAGTERIRICIHASNTSDELILLTDTINHYLG